MVDSESGKRMDFVRCDACGAKAMLAASQCPKCAEPLYVRNDRGDDVRLARCRSCHTFYPASRDGCRWCPAVKRAMVPPWISKAAAAVLAIAVGWGGWQFLPSSPPKRAPDVMTLLPPEVTRLASVAVLPSPATDSTQRAKVLPAINTGARARGATNGAPTAATRVTRDQTSTTADAPGLAPTAGSTELVSAKATTWVNVRAEANSKSPIVGIVLPDSIVELSESHRSWRRVSTRSFTGWAVAKLFVVDPLPR
jgi:hypothetical protein